MTNEELFKLMTSNKNIDMIGTLGWEHKLHAMVSELAKRSIDEYDDSDECEEEDTTEEQTNKWISCSETQRPDEDERVLVHCSGCNIGNAIYRKGKFFENAGIMRPGKILNRIVPTHWMKQPPCPCDQD